MAWACGIGSVIFLLSTGLQRNEIRYNWEDLCHAAGQ